MVEAKISGAGAPTSPADDAQLRAMGIHRAGDQSAH